MLPDLDTDEPIDWAAFAAAQPVRFSQACDQAAADALALNQQADELTQQLLEQLAHRT